MNKPSPLLSHYRFPEGQLVLFESNWQAPSPTPSFGMHLPAEVGVVLSGRVNRYANGTRQQLPRGGLWITGSLEPHGYQGVRTRSRTAVFIIRPEFLFNLHIPGVQNNFWHTPLNTHPDDRPLLIDEEFARLAEQLIAAGGHGNRPTLHAAQIQMTLLNILLLANQLGSYKTVECSPMDAFERLRPAIELLDRSRHPIATAEAARLCRLSPSRFAQLCTQATGMSFSRYSLRYRLDQVAYDLRTSDILLDELADKWGFCDKSHLATRFKEHYNATPGAYRKRERKASSPARMPS